MFLRTLQIPLSMRVNIKFIYEHNMFMLLEVSASSVDTQPIIHVTPAATRVILT